MALMTKIVALACRVTKVWSKDYNAPKAASFQTWCREKEYIDVLNDMLVPKARHNALR